MRRDLDRVLELLAAGDSGAACAAIADLEWQAFQRRDRAAGELGYARSRAEGGDLAASSQIVIRLRETSR